MVHEHEILLNTTAQGTQAYMHIWLTIQLSKCVEDRVSAKIEVRFASISNITLTISVIVLRKTSSLFICIYQKVY